MPGTPQWTEADNIYLESTGIHGIDAHAVERTFQGSAQGWQHSKFMAPAAGTLIDSANGCTETNTRLGSYIASVTGAINTSTSNITGCLAPGSGPGIGYPPAGIANSTGAAWAASYHVGTSANSLVQLNGASQLPAVSAANLTNFPTFNQSTTGTAANLSGTPTLPNGTAAFTQGAGDATTKLATDSFVSTAVGNAIPLALFTNKNLASPVSITGSTLTTVDSVSATMPSTGGPYRVLVTYAYFNSGGVNVECLRHRRHKQLGIVGAGDDQQHYDLRWLAVVANNLRGRGNPDVHGKGIQHRLGHG